MRSMLVVSVVFLVSTESTASPGLTGERLVFHPIVVDGMRQKDGPLAKDFLRLLEENGYSVSGTVDAVSEFLDGRPGKSCFDKASDLDTATCLEELARTLKGSAAVVLELSVWNSVDQRALQQPPQIAITEWKVTVGAASDPESHVSYFPFQKPSSKGPKRELQFDVALNAFFSEHLSEYIPTLKRAPQPAVAQAAPPPQPAPAKAQAAPAPATVEPSTPAVSSPPVPNPTLPAPPAAVATVAPHDEPTGNTPQSVAVTRRWGPHQTGGLLLLGVGGLGAAFGGTSLAAAGGTSALGADSATQARAGSQQFGGIVTLIPSLLMVATGVFLLASDSPTP